MYNEWYAIDFALRDFMQQDPLPDVDAKMCDGLRQLQEVLYACVNSIPPGDNPWGALHYCKMMKVHLQGLGVHLFQGLYSPAPGLKQMAQRDALEAFGEFCDEHSKFWSYVRAIPQGNLLGDFVRYFGEFPPEQTVQTAPTSPFVSCINCGQQINRAMLGRRETRNCPQCGGPFPP